VEEDRYRAAPELIEPLARRPSADLPAGFSVWLTDRKHALVVGGRGNMGERQNAAGQQDEAPSNGAEDQGGTRLGVEDGKAEADAA
jgi:hypothetical protein